MFKKVTIALILVVVFFASATVYAAKNDIERLYMPLIFKGGEEPWLWLLAYPYREEQSYVYGLTPAIDCEMSGYKEDDTIWVDVTCNGELDPYPDEFPPMCDFETGQWCQIEKVVLDVKAQRACSLRPPYNCVKRD